MRDAPIFAVGVGKTGPDDFDRGIVGEMRSQGGNHGLLLREEGWIPKDRDGGRDAILVEGEKRAPRLGNRICNPFRLGELGVNPQQNHLAGGSGTRDFGIEEIPLKDAFARLEILPILANGDSVDAGIGQNVVSTGDPGRGEGKNSARDLGRARLAEGEKPGAENCGENPAPRPDPDGFGNDPEKHVMNSAFLVPVRAVGGGGLWS